MYTLPTDEEIGRGRIPSPPTIAPTTTDEERFQLTCAAYLNTLRAIRPHQFKVSAPRLRASLSKHERLVTEFSAVLVEHNCAPAVFVYYSHRLRELVRQQNGKATSTGSPIVPPNVAFNNASRALVKAAQTYGALRFNQRLQPMCAPHVRLTELWRVAQWRAARGAESTINEAQWRTLIELARESYAYDRKNYEHAIARGEWVWSATSTTPTRSR